MSGGDLATFSLVGHYSRPDNPTAGEFGGFFGFGHDWRTLVHMARRGGERAGKVLLRDGGQQRP
jgi:hypothetical protein